MKKKLNDMFPNWLTGAGIFSTLQNFSVPWRNDNIAQSLDIEYHGNISGDKFISPLVDKMSGGEVLTESKKNMLANAILAINSANWTKQWQTLSLTYNPIQNYNINEVMNNDETVIEYGKRSTQTNELTHSKTGTDSMARDVTDTRTDNLTHSKTGTETESPDISETRTDNLTHGTNNTETLTPNTTQTTTPNITQNTTDRIRGFNSDVDVNTGSHIQSNSGTETVTRTGNEQKHLTGSETNTGTQTTRRQGENETEYHITESDSGTQANAKNEDIDITYNSSESDTGTKSLSDSGSDTKTRNYSLSRSGNIITTTQDLINKEHNLWKWKFFEEVVFPDIDRVLTLQIY